MNIDNTKKGQTKNFIPSKWFQFNKKGSNLFDLEFLLKRKFMNNAVYKLLLQAEWENFDKTGLFLGAPVDLDDGFIHLSHRHQVIETAQRHFKNQKTIYLVKFMARDLGDNLKYEPSRNDELFPHQYGVLKREHVKSFWILNEINEGYYNFPQIF